MALRQQSSSIGIKACKASWWTLLLIDYVEYHDRHGMHLHSALRPRYTRCSIRPQPITNTYPALLPFGSRNSARFPMGLFLTDRWNINSNQKASCNDVKSTLFGLVGNGQDNNSKHTSRHFALLCNPEDR